MSKYFYKLISNAQDLKNLHEEAVLNGKLEIGLSKGKMLYAWDEERNTIRVIKAEEAAKRTGLTLAQIDQIIATNAEVDFNTPEAKEPNEVISDNTIELDIEPLQDTPLQDIPESEEASVLEVVADVDTKLVAKEVSEPAAEPVQELPEAVEVNESEHVQESKAEGLNPLKTLVRRLIEALKEFDESL